MIAATDNALGSQTRTYSLAASHFPFFSQPEALSEILLAMAT
jgi:hypothetical protein